MFDLDDPEMREIVIEFCDETDELLSEMEEALDKYDEDLNETKYLEQYGQVVDRAMGASQTLGLEDIGNLCQLGKLIGYKSSQNNNEQLNEITCGILFDLVDLLKILVTNLREQKTEHSFDIKAFLGRLNWLTDKFKHIERTSVNFSDRDQVKEETPKMTTQEIQDLIDKLGS